jgi:hypothetical protein
MSAQLRHKETNASQWLQQAVLLLQRVISSLEYNHAPGYLYNVSKDRPLAAIMWTAREVLKEALPIKVCGSRATPLTLPVGLGLG